MIIHNLHMINELMKPMGKYDIIVLNGDVGEGWHCNVEGGLFRINTAGLIQIQQCQSLQEEKPWDIGHIHPVSAVKELAAR
jgi:hypothetical protein